MRSLIVAASLILAFPSFAQTYPSKPIKVVVGFPPGGASDVAARTVGTKMAERLREVAAFYGLDRFFR